MRCKLILGIGLLALIFSLSLGSCKVVAENDLVDYVARRGLEDIDRQLAMVSAQISDGTETWLLEDGGEYLDAEQKPESYTLVLYAPKETVAGRTLPDVPFVDFVVQYCKPGKNIFTDLLTSEEASSRVAVDKEEVCITGLGPGRYIVKAKASLDNFVDSEIAVWNFALGIELGLSFKIVQNGLYAFDCVLETTTFTINDWENDHTIRLYVKMYKVELGGDFKIIEIPDDFVPPIFTLLDVETPVPLNLSGSEATKKGALYYYDLGANIKPASPTEYGVKLELGYGDTAACEPVLTTITVK